MLNRRSFLRGIIAAAASVAIPIPKLGVAHHAAILFPTQLTLLQLARSRSVYSTQIAEVLSETNEILVDMLWEKRA